MLEFVAVFMHAGTLSAFALYCECSAALLSGSS